jgi:hypothetical protein
MAREGGDDVEGPGKRRESRARDVLGLVTVCAV